MANSDLVAAADNKSAVFTGHLVGTGVIHAVATTGGFTDDTGTVTVNAASAAKIVIESMADGSGTAITTETVVAGATLEVYAISRDASNNYLGNVAATWTLINRIGGVVNGDLVAAGDNKSATLTGHVPGSAIIHAVATVGSYTDDTGTITVTAGTPAKIVIETLASGTGTEIDARSIAAGSSLTAYAISRDASNNYLGNVAATWSLTNQTDGVANGDLVPAGDNKSAVFTGHAPGTAIIHAVAAVGGFTDDTGTITVTAGTPAKIVIETAADGDGTAVGTESLSAGGTLTVYAISRDAANNFIGNVAATWSLLNKMGGVVNGDLVSAGDNKSATLTGHAPGSGVIHAVATVGGYTDDTGTITVSAGPAVKIVIETAADGGGTAVGGQTIAAGATLTVYAISRDAGDNFVANVASTWSLTMITGSVVADDLVAAPDGRSATLTGAEGGSAVIHAVATVGGFTDDTGTITVTPQPRKIFGIVISKFTNAPLAGATVEVLTALGGSLVHPGATAVTAATTGYFEIDMTGVPLGTMVYVSASKPTSYSVLSMYGAFDQANEEVNFANIFIGDDINDPADYDDRRLPSASDPPTVPYYDGLLPD